MDFKIDRKVLLRRQRVKRWADRNRAFLRRKSLEHYYKNKARNLANCKRYKAEHAAQTASRFKEWKERNLEARKSYMRKWNAANRPKIKAYDSRRRVRRRLREQQAFVSDPFVNLLIAQWKNEPSFVCYYCNQTFGSDRLHIDHVIPVSADGKHTVGNVCKACDTCNLRKKEKLPNRIGFIPQTLMPF